MSWKIFLKRVWIYYFCYIHKYAVYFDTKKNQQFYGITGVTGLTNSKCNMLSSICIPVLGIHYPSPIAWIVYTILY